MDPHHAASLASTQLLDDMHYRGLLRIARREAGMRLYAPREPSPALVDPAKAMDALIDVIVAKYAPLPERTLSQLLYLLRGGAPQWAAQRQAAFERARVRLPSATVEGSRWVWPDGEDPASRRHAVEERVRLLAPFDPVVWDRRRFELFRGWAYRFEAYTPAARRLRGHYALPLLWHEQVIGWGNLALRGGRLEAPMGYVAGKAPRGAGYRAALDEELARIEVFLTPR